MFKKSNVKGLWVIHSEPLLLGSGDFRFALSDIIKISELS